MKSTRPLMPSNPSGPSTIGVPDSALAVRDVAHDEGRMAELLAKPAELAPWFDKAWDWIGSLPAKPTKK